MPMAGLGKRFSTRGFIDPKPLIKILDKPIVEWSIETLGLKGHYIFCCRKDHIENYALDKKLQNIMPNSTVISIDYQTQGTAQTVLEARKYIDNNEELVISDSDHYLIWDVKQFQHHIKNRSIDGCVMVFPNEQDSTALSYVKVNKNGYVIEAAEKIPISKIAVVGVHYFKKGSDFVFVADQMINQNLKHNNEFYVTPIYNLLVKQKKRITTFPVTKMWALGNPDEVAIFLKESKNTIHQINNYS